MFAWVRRGDGAETLEAEVLELTPENAELINRFG